MSDDIMECKRCKKDMTYSTSYEQELRMCYDCMDEVNKTSCVNGLKNGMGKR